MVNLTAVHEKLTRDSTLLKCCLKLQYTLWDKMHVKSACTLHAESVSSLVADVMWLHAAARRRRNTCSPTVLRDKSAQYAVFIPQSRRKIYAKSPIKVCSTFQESLQGESFCFQTGGHRRNTLYSFIQLRRLRHGTLAVCPKLLSNRRRRGLNPGPSL